MGGSRQALRASLASIFVVAVTLAGCGDDGSDDDGPQTRVVSITTEGFKPKRLRVETGDRVTFVNDTAYPTGLRSKEGFRTPQLQPGKRRTATFDTPAIQQIELTVNPLVDALLEVGVRESSKAAAALHITRAFGRETLSAEDHLPLHERETLLRQLRADHSVELGSDGTYVEGIDARRARYEGKEPYGWITNVNGIETDVLAPDYGLYDGDLVQWDLRDWYIALDVRATVGAFPQTFTRGVFGRMFPVEVVCERSRSRPCRQVKQTLRDAGVRIDGRREPGSKLPPAGNPRRARVLVGEWRWARDAKWSERIDEGPQHSGVFARFSPDGRSLRLLDWNDRDVRTVGDGTGLVAAMRPTEEDLMWLVTGVDAAGVERAADALPSAALRDAFAVAVTPGGVEKLPLPPDAGG